MAPEAADACRQSISINPDYAAGHRAVGELLLYQGQVDESLVELRRSAELDPRDPGTHAALARALSAKGPDADAAEETRKAQLPRLWPLNIELYRPSRCSDFNHNPTPGHSLTP